jgi:hypothetical protein
MPELIGEWHRQDGTEGRIMFVFDDADSTTLKIRWGPALSVDERWKHLP